MFNEEQIKQDVSYLCANRHIANCDDKIIDIELRKAIEQGAQLRCCTIEELKSDSTMFNGALTNMVMSALQLYDKLGVISISQNGVMNTYEDGNVYQKQDLRVFVPLARGLR